MLEEIFVEKVEEIFGNLMKQNRVKDAVKIVEQSFVEKGGDICGEIRMGML